MDKKSQIKELERELETLWGNLMTDYYEPMIKKAYKKNIDEIAKCQNQECVDKLLLKRNAPYRNLHKITKTYENAIEDCIYNCKYSMSLEMDDCYIDCFKNMKQIVIKLHEF